MQREGLTHQDDGRILIIRTDRQAAWTALLEQ